MSRSQPDMKPMDNIITTHGPSQSWWRHQRETFSALLTICAGNSPVTGKFPIQRPVTQSYGVFVDLRMNKWLRKQLWGWWFETPSCSLWRQCNVQMPSYLYIKYHCGDQTIWRKSYLQGGISYNGKAHFILNQTTFSGLTINESLNAPPNSYNLRDHHNDVIMSAMVSPITGVSIVYSTVSSVAD